METQGKLLNFLIDKQEARRLAHTMIRGKYGNIPSIGEPVFLEDKNIWDIPINVKYPRIQMDIVQEVPKKVRFMNFENVGKIKINASTGVIIDKPRYYDFRNEVIKQLDIIHMSVEKALVKTGAENFSRLPFSEHMHTPIEDIISIILLNDKLDLTKDLEILPEQDKDKYLKNIELLKNVGLLRVSNNLVLPDNSLVEIDQLSDSISKKLSDALTFFFYNGYEDISSIHQVLGPHLTISGLIFEKSVEYDEITEVNYSEIKEGVMRYYHQNVKAIKLPRYLIQLDRVGLIEQKIVKGESLWIPKKNIFEKVLGQDTILSPIREMFSPKYGMTQG